MPLRHQPAVIGGLHETYGPPVIELAGVSIGYAGRPVVRGVDLSVERGEAIAILGPNGSGKSTLVRGLLGLAEILGGRCEVFGVPVDRLTERWRIGYVPQRMNLGSGVPLTVEELVTTGRLARSRPWRLRTVADRTAIRDAIVAVGLAKHRRRPLSVLSGGQLRRAAIARALAAQPQLLVLDEPTAGVDVENRATLATVLEALVAAEVTLLVVSHEIGPVEALVGRSVVLSDGQIIHDGPPRPRDRVGADHDHEHHTHGDPPAVPGFGLTG